MIKTKAQLDYDCSSKIKKSLPTLSIDVDGTACKSIMEGFTTLLADGYLDMEGLKSSMQVDKAFGSDLSVIGANVGVVRAPGELDSVYRNRIINYPEQYTGCTINSILERIYQYEDVAEIIYKPFLAGSGSFVLYLSPTNYTISDSIMNEIQEVINNMVAGGNRGLVRRANVLNVQLKARLYFNKETSSATVNQTSVKAQCSGSIINYLNNMKVGDPLIPSQITTICNNSSKFVYDSEIEYIRINGSNIYIKNYYPTEFEVIRPATNQAVVVV